jgi:hypothetical protein
VLANEACPCTTERVGSRSSTASVFRDGCRRIERLAGDCRQASSERHLSHVACWAVAQAEIYGQTKQPQFHVIGTSGRMLTAITMYAHGQRGSSQASKYGKGRCAPSQTIGQDSVSATGIPTSVRVWNRLMLLIYVECNVPTL